MQCSDQWTLDRRRKIEFIAGCRWSMYASEQSVLLLKFAREVHNRGNDRNK